MNEQEKQKIREDWELEFDEYLSKYEHEWCCAHNESLYCHLDDEIDNTENVVPYIKDFISKTIKSKLEAVEKEISRFLDTEWEKVEEVKCDGNSIYCCPKGTIKSIKYNLIDLLTNANNK